MQISFMGVNLNYPNPITRLKSQPKTADEANEYFLTVDEATGKIPANAWDKMYGLSEEDKLKLADYMKASYLSVQQYSTGELLRPEKLTPVVQELMQTGEILSEEEIELLQKKMQGTFNPEKIATHKKMKKNEEEIFKGNLQFLKELMNEDAKIFNIMSPMTTNKILFNEYLTYEDFKESLEVIKQDDLLSPSYTDLQEEGLMRDDFRKKVIHETLLGESYSKIMKVDRHIYELHLPYITPSSWLT